MPVSHTNSTSCSVTFLLALMANMPASVHTLLMSAPIECVCGGEEGRSYTGTRIHIYKHTNAQRHTHTFTHKLTLKMPT